MPVSNFVYLDRPFNLNRDNAAPICSGAAGVAFKNMWTLDDVNVCEQGELADRGPAAHVDALTPNASLRCPPG